MNYLTEPGEYAHSHALTFDRGRYLSLAKERWAALAPRIVFRRCAFFRFALAIGVLSGDALAACQVPGSLKEESPTWCISFERCVWNESILDCKDKSEMDALSSRPTSGQSKLGDSFLSRDGYNVSYSTANQSSLLDDETINQALGCPTEVMDYVGRYNPEAFDPGGGVIGIESASDYIDWNTFGESTTARERKIRLRTAWLSLRKDGACRRWLLGSDRNKPDNVLRLVMSREADINWRLAKRGNAFNGVIDCRTWEVFLVPQNPRTDNKTSLKFNQLPWKTSQLKKVELTRSANASSAPVYELQPEKGLDHGVVALMSEGKSLDAPKTLADWCRQERELKANYLGFNVWTDATTGQLAIKFTSRQLNGPNLDRYILTDPDDHDNYTEQAELFDAREQVVYSEKGLFLNRTDASEDLNEDLKNHRGVLSIDIAIALKETLGALPLPKK